MMTSHCKQPTIRRALRWLLPFLLLAPFAAALLLARPADKPPQPRIPEARMSRLDRARASSLLSGKTTAHTDRLATARDTADRKRYGVFHAEFTSAAARKALPDIDGLTVYHAHERFASCFVASDAALEKLLDTEGLRFVEIAGIAVIPPVEYHAAKGAPREAPRTAAGGVDGLTGKGVVVAIIDSGLDFRHADFRTEQGGKPVSRLLYYWDTTHSPRPGGPGSAAPLKYPDGTPIGTIYTQDDLTSDLRSGQRVIPEADDNGHGTACAGIAAGNGRTLDDRRFKGVAPEADLIGVRIGSRGSGLPNAYLLNAICVWLDRTVKDRPLVISCSFGGERGGRDGNLIQERMLSELFPPTTRNRVICVAGGNSGDAPLFHAVLRSDRAGRNGVRYETARACDLSVYVDTERPEDVDLTIEGVGEAEVNRYFHPIEQALVFEAQLPDDSKGAIRLSARGKDATVAHAYLTALSGGKEKTGGKFIGDTATKGGILSVPSTARSALCVGSYDFNDGFEFADREMAVRLLSDEPLKLGGLSAYSSTGGLRKGALIKPDIVAPGQFWTAPAVKATPPLFLHRSRSYQIFNGTSAATPYTAGVVALMMERKPGLTTAQVRALFKEHAIQDEFTGKVPNPQWGNGKLDLEAILNILKALR